MVKSKLLTTRINTIEIDLKNLQNEELEELRIHKK